MATRELRAVPRWAAPVTFTLSFVGLGLSLYLTITHFDATLINFCSNQHSVIDCSAVTTSAQSRFIGVPVAFLGLGDYLVMAALTSPRAWSSRRRWLHVARFELAVVNMAFVLWLLYAELIIIDHLCLFCSGVHVVTFVMLIVLTRVSPAQLGWDRRRDETVAAVSPIS